MRYLILLFGILSITVVTALNFYPDEVFSLADSILNKKEFVIAKENDYFIDSNFEYVTNYTDDIHNKKELLNYIYYVVNTGSDYADGECVKEYSSCIDDLKVIANDEETLSLLNNFVHPYNSFNTITFTPTGKNTFSIAIDHIYTKEEIAEINYIVDIKLKELITDDMAISQKIKVIHDYIIDNTKYDTLKSENIHDETYKSNTAYGVLIQEYGICSGYSDAMATFLNALGIENYRVSNDTHIWNLVYVNGVWVHLDATWDDPISEFNENRDTYFLINYDTLSEYNDGTHMFDKNIYKEAY